MSVGAVTVGDDFCILMTADAQERMRRPLGDGGALTFRVSKVDDTAVVSKVELNGSTYPVVIPNSYRALRAGEEEPIGRWRTVDRELNVHHRLLVNRPLASLAFSAFKKYVPGVSDPGMLNSILVTRAVNLGETDHQARVQEFAAWRVSRSGAVPLPCAVEPIGHGIHQLDEHWPTQVLKDKSVLLVGAGSVGSHAAIALAGAGVGTLDIVDPDRLLWHNLVRHALGAEHVGRHKVDALKAHLAERWPDTEVHPYVANIVDDAAHFRSLLAEYDVVLCTADGINPRRALSHMARRARKPLVLACVLDDGGIGEVLRLMPTRSNGCLDCNREAYRRRGAIDAEADQEAAYGEGLLHKPMTAVGPDLALVGNIAAKVGLSTILHSAGFREHTLPGDHLIIGLHPIGDLSAPYNSASSLDVHWRKNVRPYAECPTCNPR